MIWPMGIQDENFLHGRIVKVCFSLSIINSGVVLNWIFLSGIVNKNLHFLSEISLNAAQVESTEKRHRQIS